MEHLPAAMPHDAGRAKPLATGLIAGAGIAAVDNFALRGEVSPIVIVALLLMFTIAAGIVWGRRAWVATAGAWCWLPMAHVVKHVLGLPDTLHPNTYASIAMLAVFTLAIAAVGTGCGLAVRAVVRM